MEKDILGREHYVKEILNYVDIKKNKVLCLNGEWGCGKTFIVKRLIEEMEILNPEASKPYFPIYINAWEYDYYDEPLEGLVLALYDYAFPKIEQVVKDKQVDLFLKRLIFCKDGKLIEENKNVISNHLLWTKSKVIDNKYSMTSSKYEILKIENVEYLIYEWKSGDYIFGKRKPGKYILIKE